MRWNAVSRCASTVRAVLPLHVTATPGSTAASRQVLGPNGKRILGTGAHLVSGDFMERWAEIERDWDENVIPNLWMNTDEE